MRFSYLDKCIKKKGKKNKRNEKSRKRKSTRLIYIYSLSENTLFSSLTFFSPLCFYFQKIKLYIFFHFPLFSVSWFLRFFFFHVNVVDRKAWALAFFLFLLFSIFRLCFRFTAERSLPLVGLVNRTSRVDLKLFFFSIISFFFCRG